MSLREYFDSFYPSRTSLLGRLLFRHGEEERRAVVRQCLGRVDGLSILDIGCGDGVFLASILDGRPARIVCEDVSARAVASAVQTLAPRADAVEGVVRDSFNAALERADVVMAIGVLDYQSAWGEALATIEPRARRTLIVTIPRRDRLRNLIRRIWFHFHGIGLQSASRHDVRGFDVRASPYDWVVRIER